MQSSKWFRSRGVQTVAVPNILTIGSAQSGCGADPSLVSWWAKMHQAHQYQRSAGLKQFDINLSRSSKNTVYRANVTLGLPGHWGLLTMPFADKILVSWVNQIN